MHADARRTSPNVRGGHGVGNAQSTCAHVMEVWVCRVASCCIHSPSFQLAHTRQRFNHLLTNRHTHAPDARTYVLNMPRFSATSQLQPIEHSFLSATDGHAPAMMRLILMCGVWFVRKSHSHRDDKTWT
jgi:hypothetical protein